MTLCFQIIGVLCLVGSVHGLSMETSPKAGALMRQAPKVAPRIGDERADISPSGKINSKGVSNSEVDKSLMRRVNDPSQASGMLVDIHAGGEITQLTADATDVDKVDTEMELTKDQAVAEQTAEDSQLKAVQEESQHKSTKINVLENFAGLQEKSEKGGKGGKGGKGAKGVKGGTQEDNHQLKDSDQEVETDLEEDSMTNDLCSGPYWENKTVQDAEDHFNSQCMQVYRYTVVLCNNLASVTFQNLVKTDPWIPDSAICSEINALMVADFEHNQELGDQEAAEKPHLLEARAAKAGNRVLLSKRARIGIGMGDVDGVALRKSGGRRRGEHSFGGMGGIESSRRNDKGNMEEGWKKFTSWR